MNYLWTCFILFLESIKPEISTPLFDLFYHPHTLMLCLFVTGLYPEKEEWLTIVDWQYIVYSVLPSSSWLKHVILLHDSLDAL